jgi:hypothetical protein
MQEFLPDLPSRDAREHQEDEHVATGMNEDATGMNDDAAGMSDGRQLPRASLFIMADLRLDGENFEHRIKMRNLSAGGLMAEGTVQAMRGMAVSVKLRDLGWVEGTVAWVQANRFGIAFHAAIDPDQVRIASAPSPEMIDSVVIRRNVAVSASRSAGQLRKV